MEELLEILNSIDDTIDYAAEDALVDDGILTSMDLMELISEMEDTFSVEIDMDDITPENFNSVKSMLALVDRLHAES